MNLHFIRHATFVVELGTQRLLVDPMLSPAGALDPVGNAADQRRIPLVELPLDDAALARLLAGIDGVLVTHTHRDHWDARAIALLPKDLPILCQPESAQEIGAAGFSSVVSVASRLQWRDLELARIGGHHGTGAIGRAMGTVSGFVLRAAGEPVLYIAGDTIWCAEVETALREYRPDVTVLNAGAAQFLSGAPITMTAEEVAHVCRACPDTRVIALHMEAINHCLLTRAALDEHLRGAGLRGQVEIPADGDRLVLSGGAGRLPHA